MELATRALGHVLVVSPLGKRLDASQAPSFKARMIELIEAGQLTIVLDLSNVEFVDSSGLGAIVGCLKRLGQRGDLAIAGAGRSVAKVFALTRMDKVFRMHETPDEAVRALSD